MKGDYRSRIKTYEYEDIMNLYENYKFNELNNVIEGFETDFFTIQLFDEIHLDEYNLIYIAGHPELKGLALKSGRKLKDRDLITVAFAKAVEDEFPSKNCVTIFNTFQNIIKQTYENYGILCIPRDFVNLKSELAFVLPNRPKSDVDYILEIEPIEFYRSFFDSQNTIPDKQNITKVYLMVEGKHGFIKIGKTKNKLSVRRKGVAEPTLMAADPIIEVISAWKAPQKIEKELHLLYDFKRKRGEWFDLRATDLKDINELMLPYKRIKIE